MCKMRLSNFHGARQGCNACPYITKRSRDVVKSVTITSNGVQIVVEGKISCTSKGGFIYLLWSAKDPIKKYLGSSVDTPGYCLASLRDDIANQRLDMAVPAHFHSTNSGVDDLVFMPVKLFKKKYSAFRWMIKNISLVREEHEMEFINKYNLGDAGIERIIT